MSGNVWQKRKHVLFGKAIVSVFGYSAVVWGSSVKHQPQKCGKEHVLADEDVVQIVKK
jgi:ribosome-interacting GTPase 1